MNHLGTQVLESERLILRRFKQSDAKEIYEGYVNQEGFLYYAHKEKRTLEEEINSLKGIDAKYEKNDYYNWLITLKENNKIIGAINLKADDYNESLEFNYAIDDRCKGNGYMTEALKLIKDYCFNELNVNRLYGGCEINNIGSKRVMEKCQMTYEGCFRSKLFVKGRFRDIGVCSILASEYFTVPRDNIYKISEKGSFFSRLFPSRNKN